MSHMQIVLEQEKRQTLEKEKLVSVEFNWIMRLKGLHRQVAQMIRV